MNDKLEQLKSLIEQDIKECKYYQPIGNGSDEIAIQIMKQILGYINDLQNEQRMLRSTEHNNRFMDYCC